MKTTSTSSRIPRPLGLQIQLHGRVPWNHLAINLLLRKYSYDLEYPELRKTDVRFTSCASYFRGKDLMESKALRMVWRVAFCREDQDSILRNPKIFQHIVTQAAGRSLHPRSRSTC